MNPETITVLAVVSGIGFFLTLGFSYITVRNRRSRRLAVHQLKVAQLTLDAAVVNSPMATVVLDEHGVVLKCNLAFGTLVQQQQGDIVGRQHADLVLGGYTANRTDSKPASNGPKQREARYTLETGIELWVSESTTPFLGSEGESRTLMQIVDVSRDRKIRDDLQRRVMHDGLTRLPNRALLGDRIIQALIRGRRTGCSTAVILLDIDYFKTINDGLGHHVGDQVIREVADRLRAHTRVADTLARFGGDEFVMLCEGLERPGDALILAERIQELMREPFEVGNRSVALTLSIGIAVSNSSDSPQALLRDADLAMYQAKELGRDRISMFAREMREHLADSWALEDQLRAAITGGDLRLHYQAILDVKTQTIVGYESLVRWVHPMRGMLNPGEFLHVAEQLDLLTDIDEWTLRTASAQLADWLRRRQVAADCVIGVNASARNFVNAAYPALVKDILDQTGLEPHHLVIEITEDAVLSNTDRAGRIIQELRALGVRVAIDDFGTGYSSFSQLATLEFDFLKIDQSFTSQISERPGREIVFALIQMARALGLKTVIEGVESEADLALLAELGADLAQGYVIARPLAAERVPKSAEELALVNPGVSGSSDDTLQHISVTGTTF